MKPIIILLLGLFLAHYGKAQTDSLNRYVERALKNNPTVQQKWSEYKASLEKIPQVGSLPDPELSMEFFLKPMEQLGGNQVANLQLMQEFPWFGVLKNAKDEMSLMAQASFASFESTKLDIAYEVRLRWYKLYQNRQQVAILKKNLELLHQLKRLATTTYQAGSARITASSSITGSSPSGTSQIGNEMGGMGTDVAKRPSMNTLQIAPSGMGQSSGMRAASTGGLGTIYSLQLEENNLTNQLASLEDAYGYLTFGFNKLLNRAETASIVVPVGDVTDPFQPPSDTVLNQNPMLVMLDYEREAMEARKKMAEQMGYPMVGVGLSYSVISKNPTSTSMMNGRDMLMPMVSVSLPLYRKKYKALEQETAWQQTAYEQAYEATRNQLQAEYNEALFRYRDAVRRVQLAESQQQLAAKTYQLQRTRLAASNGSLEDLLLTARQQVDYDLQLVNARIDVLMAQAQIRQLAGSF